MKSRRQFLRITGTGLVAAGLSSAIDLKANPLAPGLKSTDRFTLGIAGYTFREFNIDGAIAIMKRVGVTNLSLKDFHMPMNSTREQIKAVIGKFTDAGINVYTVGVVYMSDEAAVDQAFEYAKMAGVSMIVGAPDYKVLPYVEKKVKQYDFRVAIHNHGPDNPLFPNATDIWNHIKDMDPRMGICIDIGHTIRDGADPAVDIERYANRIFDMHIKDVDKASKEGVTVEMGRGIINIPAVIASIRKIGYSGRCSLEFEKDMKDPLPGIAESIGYWKGVAACG